MIRRAISLKDKTTCRRLEKNQKVLGKKLCKKIEVFFREVKRKWLIMLSSIPIIRKEES